MALRTTLVGCGAVAQGLNRKPLQKLERRGILQVVALVDRHGRHAETLRSFFPRAAVFEDMSRALESGDSELSLSLSPAPSHSEQSLIAFEHENHVLCEKPMATSVEGCDNVIAAASESGRVFAVGM